MAEACIVAFHLLDLNKVLHISTAAIKQIEKIKVSLLSPSRLLLDLPWADSTFKHLYGLGFMS